MPTRHWVAPARNPRSPARRPEPPNAVTFSCLSLPLRVRDLPGQQSCLPAEYVCGPAIDSIHPLIGDEPQAFNAAARATPPTRAEPRRAKLTVIFIRPQPNLKRIGLLHNQTPVIDRAASRRPSQTQPRTSLGARAGRSADDQGCCPQDIQSLTGARMGKRSRPKTTRWTPCAANAAPSYSHHSGRTPQWANTTVGQRRRSGHRHDRGRALLLRAFCRSRRRGRPAPHLRHHRQASRASQRRSHQSGIAWARRNPPSDTR